MKRTIDIILALVFAFILLLPCLIISLLVKATSRGKVIYWSDRVGRNEIIFRMPKFRTMQSQAPEKATHLIEDPRSLLTPVGSFLRKNSLDEIPQLISIIKGDLTFVGPRPALYNQLDLIAMRKAAGVNILTPGITGWAQVNGRDELSISQKVDFDREYLESQSFAFDLYIIWLTFLKVLRRQNISH